MFSFQTGSDQLQGGFYPSYYGIQPGAIKYGPRAFLGSFDSGHPIMSGITTFDGGIDSYRPSTTVFPNVAVVAKWSDNVPLVATFTINGVKRVDLGFWPASNRVDPGSWVITTNGTLIMVNALNYAMSSSSCAAQTSCSSCTNAGCQWCLDTGVCSSFDPTCKNRVNTPKYCPLDCTSFATCPSCLDSSNGGACSWCLDNNSCVSGTVNTCRNDINNPKYCNVEIGL